MRLEEKIIKHVKEQVLKQISMQELVNDSDTRFINIPFMFEGVLDHLIYDTLNDSYDIEYKTAKEGVAKIEGLDIAFCDEYEIKRITID